MFIKSNNVKVTVFYMLLIASGSFECIRLAVMSFEAFDVIGLAIHWQHLRVGFFECYLGGFLARTVWGIDERR